jgi:Protein of unknown function (DUF2752)
MNCRTRRWTANLSALSLGMGAAMLWRFPPTASSFYPSCPVYTMLHLYCPGCGGTRALAALLQGQFAQAVHFNPVFVGLLPFLLVFLALSYWRAIYSDKFQWPAISDSWLKLLLALIFVFTVVRNLSPL